MRVHKPKCQTVRQVFLCVVTACILCSCGIGPVYSPPLSPERSGLKLRDKDVIVTKFYKAETDLSYLGDSQISMILESARLFDTSFDLARYLTGNDINATGMKDAPVNSLKDNEVMLSGSIITKSIPMDENVPVPFFFIILLVGNILPSPVAYVSGVDVIYQYELVDSSGRILQSVEKDTRVYYKDYYVWGRIFGYKNREERIKENIDGQIFDLIETDLFQ